MEDNRRIVEMIRILKENDYEMEDLEQLFLAIERQKQEDEGVAEEKKTRNRIMKILMEIGIPQANKGYQLLVAAIQIVYENFIESGYCITKIYDTIAKQYGMDRRRVERNIRTVIESGFMAENDEVIKKIFGNTVSSRTGKLANKQFISAISNYMKMKD